MDRQAWIAITLCVIGLVLWQIYMMKNPAPRPVQTAPAPTPISSIAPASPSSSAPPNLSSPAPGATPPLAESVPTFAEKKEILRNSDMELRLTNRGGAISEVVLLNHVAEGSQRVVLNSPDRPPIGAIVQRPETPTLPEFTVSRAQDGSVQFERATPERVDIRKKFFFPPTSEKKDNFVAQMDVAFRNDGAQPYNHPNYFLTLGSARPIHPNDMPNYTHLTWCVAGKAKSIDVNWFAPQSSFFGLQKRPGARFLR